MKLAIIGRTEILYNTALMLRDAGHEIVCILTSAEAPEYLRSASDFELLAQSWNIPFAKGSKITKHREFLVTSKADLAVSINYTGVIPQEIIDLYPLGILNAHGGDLPRYRGNACQAWAILNGEERIGLCIHKMIGGELDSGDIIARDYLQIDHNTKVGDVWDWMTLETPRLMLEAVNGLSSDPGFKIETQSKNPKDALRCYPRKPEDGRIDWSKPVIDILRLINASNRPYAGAFCHLEGEKLVIWDAEIVKGDEIFCAVPGQITRIGGSGVEVVCGSGKLLISSVGYQGNVCAPDSIIKSIRKRLS